MKINKTCACGEFHEYLPEEVKPWPETGLILFNCKCNSTLSVKCPHEEIDDERYYCLLCDKDCREELYSGLIDGA